MFLEVGGRFVKREYKLKTLHLGNKGANNRRVISRLVTFECMKVVKLLQ